MNGSFRSMPFLLILLTQVSRKFDLFCSSQYLSLTPHLHLSIYHLGILDFFSSHFDQNCGHQDNFWCFQGKNKWSYFMCSPISILSGFWKDFWKSFWSGSSLVCFAYLGYVARNVLLLFCILVEGKLCIYAG